MNEYSSNIFYLFTRPEELSTKGILSTSILLVVLLNFCAPLLSSVTPIPLLGAVALVGITYSIFAVVTDSALESLTSAAFVLATYSANVPILGGSSNATFGVLLADLVVVPLTLLLVYWSRWKPRFRERGRYVLAALAVFVSWSFLAAFVSNGPSSPVGLAFALSTVRYVFYFVVAFLLSRHVTILDTLYPLLVAAMGHVVLAVLEAYVGAAYGFTQLGDATGDPIGQFTVLSVEFTAGLFAGGFAGTSRVLVSVLLLVAPAVVAISVMKESRLSTLLPLAVLPATAFLVRISETDAGLAAVLLVFTSVGLLAAYQLFIQNRSKLRMTLLGTILSIALTVALFRADSVSETTQKGTDVPPTKTQDIILQLIENVPGITSDTLLIRLQQYTAAIDVGLQFPLFGIGGWNFEILSQSYGFEKQRVIHNTYLAYFAEVGFPGSLAFLIAILLPLVSAIKLARTAKPKEATLCWSLVIGSIAFHAYAFWTSIYYSPVSYGVLWLVNGLVVGARYRSEYFRPEPVENSKR